MTHTTPSDKAKALIFALGIATVMAGVATAAWMWQSGDAAPTAVAADSEPAVGAGAHPPPTAVAQDDGLPETVTPTIAAQANSRPADATRAGGVAPVSERLQDNAATCDAEREIRLVVDNSVSMKGFFSRRNREKAPDLANLLGRLRNEVRSSVLATSTSGGREDGGNESSGPRNTEFFVGYTGNGGHPVKRRRKPPACGPDDECPRGLVCCLPRGHDSDADMKLSCLPKRDCGPISVAETNTWSLPESYRATRSTVSRGIRTLFDACVHTGILVTDGLESPPNVSGVSCDPSSRPQSADPGLVQLLRQYVSKHPERWGVWILKAVLPFSGRVYLECGQRDMAMRVLGKSVAGAGGELHYETKGVDAQAVMIVVVTRGGPAHVRELSQHLHKTMQEFVSGAREHGRAMNGVQVDGWAVQIWPPQHDHPCAMPKLSVYTAGASGDARKSTGDGSSAAGVDQRRPQVLVRYTAPSTPAPVTFAPPVVAFERPELVLRLGPWTESESLPFWNPVGTAADMPILTTQEAAALVRTELAVESCRSTYSELLTHGPSSGRPATSQGAGPLSAAYFNVGCVATLLQQKLAEKAAQGNSGQLDVQRVPLDLELRCSRASNASTLMRLRNISGRRFTPADAAEATRGIPGTLRAMEALATWALASAPPRHTGPRSKVWIDASN